MTVIDDNINHEYIIRYIRSVLPEQNGLLRELETYAKEHDVPISQPETIRMIEVLMKSGGIKRVLEIGSAIGYSAIRMAEATDAEVDTIEINEEMVRLARENLRRAGLESRVRILCGDANEVLEGLGGAYDMIFVDAAKAQYNRFFPHCMRLLKEGGLLVSDNILYKGMTATDELVQHRKRTIVKRLRVYLEMLRDHPDLDTAVLPVGDGVALSYKKTGDRK